MSHEPSDLFRFTLTHFSSIAHISGELGGYLGASLGDFTPARALRDKDRDKIYHNEIIIYHFHHTS